MERPESPWLRAREAASYARVSLKVLYSAARRQELRVARAGAGRMVIFHRDWLDAWHVSRSSVVDVRTGAVIGEIGPRRGAA